ncbi:L-rhamnose mutarotase [Hymenobacter volaticus]|uniref:L-rhamnose mutarotase n=1 Tax=Hymenobacter volaticus TaxID=2932254 RepID=A0ABY4GAX3_9BACT|nr:L-rhamnose mutarotase [Hymenobacter volaticus]UOQ67983.1 L-rhamnose mutarotase [Hymenobacter volaticus]
MKKPPLDTWNEVKLHTCVLPLLLVLNSRGSNNSSPKHYYLSRPRSLVCLLTTVLLLFALGSACAQTSGKAAILEVVGLNAAPVAADKLLALCKQYQVPTSSVYRWQNHLVVYGPAASIQRLQQPLTAAYPGATVKHYAAPFYKFDRQWCTDKTVSQQWDNLLLTANLVRDPAKQQEYLRYHATQFELWPEVAAGFCKASFQQLLVFRNERQLMLVISVPKGASLDELNPKTTENNPRVDEWNALMKQYQEGIPGTKPGDVWVFLKPVAAPVKTIIK